MRTNVAVRAWKHRTGWLRTKLYPNLVVRVCLHDWAGSKRTALVSFVIGIRNNLAKYDEYDLELFCLETLSVYSFLCCPYLLSVFAYIMRTHKKPRIVNSLVRQLLALLKTFCYSYRSFVSGHDDYEEEGYSWTSSVRTTWHWMVVIIKHITRRLFKYVRCTRHLYSLLA